MKKKQTTCAVAELYTNFMDEKIQAKHSDYKLLNSRWIGNKYIGILANDKEALIVVDNNPISDVYHIKLFNCTNGYVGLNLYNLNVLPNKLLVLLLNNGLLMNGNTENKTAMLNLHRLVKCLTINITGYTINHNDYNPKNNHINNLSVMTQQENLDYNKCKGDKKAQKQFLKNLTFNDRPICLSLRYPLDLMRNSYSIVRVLTALKSYKYRPIKKLQDFTTKNINGVRKFFFYADEFLEAYQEQLKEWDWRKEFHPSHW